MTEFVDPRPDWHEYFLDIAEAVAKRADCTRRQVGAVLVKNHRIIATGYNGAPARWKGCLEGWCPRGTKSKEELPGYADGNHDYSDCISIHAEMNAILYSSLEDRQDATIYVTCKPCNDCSKHLRGAGVYYCFYRTPEGGIAYTETGLRG